VKPSLLLIPLALALLGLSTLALTRCDAPLGAIRRSPPAGISTRVIAARTPAPDFSLSGTAGPFRLSEALAKGGVLLVFYRGHW
jgi:hypothetical protein